MKNKTFSDFKDALTNKEVEGYIWMVEDEYPRIYSAENGKKIINFEGLKTDDKPHNRIQEAYILCDDTSYHLKNIDGKELIFIIKEDDFKSDDFKISEDLLKLPSRFFKGNNLVFKQIYQLEASISGENFKTWQPIGRLFQGFAKPINQPKSK